MIMEETSLRTASLPSRSYTIIEPRCEWSQSADCYTLTVDVLGFEKEQLRVLANTRRKLKVSGERHLGGNRWARFVREFQIPKNCRIKGIRVKHNAEEQMLTITIPKSSRGVESEKQPIESSPSMQPIEGSPSMDRSASEKMESSDGQASKASPEENLEAGEGAAQRVEESIEGEREKMETATKSERDLGEIEEEFPKEDEKMFPTKKEKDLGETEEKFPKEEDGMFPTKEEEDLGEREEEFPKEEEQMFPTKEEKDLGETEVEFPKGDETYGEGSAQEEPRERFGGLKMWFSKIKKFLLYVVVPICIIVGVGIYLM